MNDSGKFAGYVGPSTGVAPFTRLYHPSEALDAVSKNPDRISESDMVVAMNILRDSVKSISMEPELYEERLHAILVAPSKDLGVSPQREYVVPLASEIGSLAEAVFRIKDRLGEIRSRIHLI